MNERERENLQRNDNKTEKQAFYLHGFLPFTN